MLFAFQQRHRAISVFLGFLEPPRMESAAADQNLAAAAAFGIFPEAFPGVGSPDFLVGCLCASMISPCRDILQALCSQLGQESLPKIPFRFWVHHSKTHFNPFHPF